MSGVETVVGITASFVTLFDLVQKIHKLYVDVKDAEKEWQRYREGFQAVVGLKSAVDVILAKHPDISRLPIEVAGKEDPVQLVDQLQDCLSAVIQDAEELLDRSSHVSTCKQNSRVPNFSKLVKSLLRASKAFTLVLDKDTVMRLMNRVEDALNHLHVGLTLIHFGTSVEGQSRIETTLDEIKAKLGQERPKDSGWLRDRQIKVKLRVIGPSDIRPRSGQAGKDKLARKTPATKSKSKGALFKGQVQGNELTLVPSKGKRSQEVENVDDGHDDDDEEGDDEEQCSLDVTHNETQKLSNNASCKPGYEVIVENEQLIQISADSVTGQQACGLQDTDTSLICATPATAMRLEARLETTSESEWKEKVRQPVSAIMAYLTSATDDSDTKTERALGECGDEGDETEKDQRESRSIPLDANAIENKVTFNLLKRIVLDNTFDPPRNITLDTLVRFLTLIDKHGWCKEKKTLDQAKIWVSTLQPPEVLGHDAVPWLWIAWKLRMNDVFKKLSSLIQRHGTDDVSSWQDGPDNTYNIRLPYSVINRLDQRRINALSRIRDKLTSLMDRYREEFDFARDYFLHGDAHILISSLAFGYLQLETERCLDPYGLRRLGAHVYFADFHRVSFANVKKGIFAMEELSDWKISYDPLETPFNIRSRWFNLSIRFSGKVFPERNHFRLPVGFKGDLEALVEHIESEGWGFDLDQIEE